MNLGVVHDGFNFCKAALFSIIYIPHMFAYVLGGGKSLVDSDISAYAHTCRVPLNRTALLLYLLHNNGAFRKLFYHRLGVIGVLISWIRPGEKTLLISKTMPIGRHCYLAHPLSTILSARSIGDNFSCMQLTTIGKEKGGNPVIGNNVRLGANVTIIGDIRIEDNVIVGAGSVVINDIPENCVVVGIPAKIVKRLT